MPIIKSAKKRVKVADKATIRNRKTKRSVKSSIKALVASISGNKKDAPKLLAKAQSDIDKAIKKGVIHKNKGARKKAQLAKIAQNANVKPATSPSKKPAKNKSTTSKSATQKVTKTATKAKPTTKKTTTKK